MPLLSLILDICRLRRGPQDMPHSPALLALAAAACVTLQLAIALLRGAPPSEVFIGALLGLVFTFTVLHVVLTLRGLRNRFVQTATTLLFCSLVFTLISVPIVLLAGTPPAETTQVSPLHLLLGVVALPLLVWKVLVDAHVLRHSLNLPFLGGLVLALLWIVAGMALVAATGAAPPS